MSRQRPTLERTSTRSISCGPSIIVPTCGCSEQRSPRSSQTDRAARGPAAALSTLRPRATGAVVAFDAGGGRHETSAPAAARWPAARSTGSARPAVQYGRHEAAHEPQPVVAHERGGGAGSSPRQPSGPARSRGCRARASRRARAPADLEAPAGHLADAPGDRGARDPARRPAPGRVCVVGVPPLPCCSISSLERSNEIRALQPPREYACARHGLSSRAPDDGRRGEPPRASRARWCRS